MKKLLFLTLILFTIALPEFQNAQAEPEIRRAEPVERTEKKTGLFERLFKKRREDSQKPTSPEKSEPETGSTPPTKKAIATKASEIEATPKPKPRRKPKSTPTPALLDDQSESSPPKSEISTSPGPEATPETADSNADSQDLASHAPTPNRKLSPAPGPEFKPEPSPTIKEELDPAQLMQSIPFVSTSKSEISTASSTPDLLDPEYVKKVNDRYKNVRSKALEDEKVSALKDEADGAFEPAKRAETLKLYYEALFEKMREIDPSLKTRIDGRERATMRRIESLTPVGE